MQVRLRHSPVVTVETVIVVGVGDEKDELRDQQHYPREVQQVLAHPDCEHTEGHPDEHQVDLHSLRQAPSLIEQRKLQQVTVVHTVMNDFSVHHFLLVGSWNENFRSCAYYRIIVYIFQFFNY